MLFIQFIMRSYALIQGLLLASSAWAVEPAAVYNGGYNSTKNVALRIGNGGAGQSGLIEGKPYPQCHDIHTCLEERHIF